MKLYFGFLLIVGTLCGCVRAGDYDLLPLRKNIVSSIRGYTIHNFDSESYSTTTNLRDMEVVMNKALTAGKGSTILSDKFYDKSVYKKIVFKPSKSGNLQSNLGTFNLDAKNVYEVKYWIGLDGKKQYLLDSGLDGYFYLFDEQGNFLERLGVEKDGNLVLLEDDIMIYPSNMKMLVSEQTSNQVSRVHKGYEVKYSGTEIGRIWFDYLDYKNGQESGEFERISFPNKPGLININGIGLRVLKADDNSITYMILKQED